jgi:hypothetical protein
MDGMANGSLGSLFPLMSGAIRSRLRMHTPGSPSKTRAIQMLKISKRYIETWFFQNCQQISFSDMTILPGKAVNIVISGDNVKELLILLSLIVRQGLGSQQSKGSPPLKPQNYASSKTFSAVDFHPEFFPKVLQICPQSESA